MSQGQKTDGSHLLREEVLGDGGEFSLPPSSPSADAALFCALHPTQHIREKRLTFVKCAQSCLQCTAIADFYVVLVFADTGELVPHNGWVFLTVLNQKTYRAVDDETIQWSSQGNIGASNSSTTCFCMQNGIVRVSGLRFLVASHEIEGSFVIRATLRLVDQKTCESNSLPIKVTVEFEKAVDMQAIDDEFDLSTEHNIFWR
eukprot:c13465_g1_i1.p1 GENE.c13465_g1_i1~~c13465_g1_i1.p1  ORF type:complete len:202 (+),score=43.02 c13465_g1_i1:133-738(+)